MDHLSLVLSLAFVVAFVVYIVRRRAKRKGGTGTVTRVIGYLGDRLDTARRFLRRH